MPLEPIAKDVFMEGGGERNLLIFRRSDAGRSRASSNRLAPRQERLSAAGRLSYLERWDAVGPEPALLTKKRRKQKARTSKRDSPLRPTTPMAGGTFSQRSGARLRIENDPRLGSG